jgi:hypothetical protein
VLQQAALFEIEGHDEESCGGLVSGEREDAVVVNLGARPPVASKPGTGLQASGPSGLAARARYPNLAVRPSPTALIVQHLARAVSSSAASGSRSESCRHREAIARSVARAASLEMEDPTRCWTTRGLSGTANSNPAKVSWHQTTRQYWLSRPLMLSQTQVCAGREEGISTLHPPTETSTSVTGKRALPRSRIDAGTWSANRVTALFSWTRAEHVIPHRYNFLLKFR